MATCSINLRKHPTKKSSVRKTHLIFDDFEDIALQDISDIILKLADCETDEQVRLGNKPTHKFVNNKPSSFRTRTLNKNSLQFAFRARAMFGTATQIVDAALEAMRLLTTLTRMDTGDARGSYWIYLGNTADTSNPGVLRGFNLDGIYGLRDQVTENSMISIIGPNVIYGRKLYWNPLGGRTVSKRLARAPKGLNFSVRLLTKNGGYRGSATIHRDVKKRMARKVAYKSLSFADPFYVMGASDIIGDKRVPAISIMMKSGGRLN